MSIRSIAPLALALFGWIACASGSGGNAPEGTAGASGAGAGGAGQAGSSGAAGSSTAGASAGGGGGAAGRASGAAGAAGGGAAGSPGSAGTPGAAGASGTPGAAGNPGAAGATGAAGAGGDPGDTPPWRKLDMNAATDELKHQYGGNSVGIDGRSMALGKLVVELGVSSGSYISWLGKRGFHVMGVSFSQCGVNNWDAGRDVDDKCRQSEWVTIAAKVKAGLASLQEQAATEDWGYFLNQDGSVRWSDVIVTGMSHGATTAAYIGRVGARVWRVVSRSGPRDNTCGTGSAKGAFDAANPPWNAACPIGHIASWIDAPSKTPMDRFYALVGTEDVEYGDIMFHMKRAGYVGAPVQWNVASAVLTGTNQFYSTVGGHLDFLEAGTLPLRTDEVLDIAFAIPPANQHPAF
jgi:hypothetical protein